MATGTGKTFIVFQIAWKLFHSRWNRGDWKTENEPTRRPRILFLADRNILADQAFNAFSAFPEDALVRIAPEDIRKKGKVPKNGSIFFTIFQTFMALAGSATGPQFNVETHFDEISEIKDAFGYMYLHECADGSLYTGSTTNLRARLQQHNDQKDARHTVAREPVKLIYYETFDRIDKAFAREKQVQGWGRQKKIALTKGNIDLLKQSPCVSVGVEELDSAKLKPLLCLKYHDSIADAVADLGKPEEIGKVFSGFQKYLYQETA